MAEAKKKEDRPQVPDGSVKVKFKDSGKIVVMQKKIAEIYEKRGRVMVQGKPAAGGEK